MARLGGASAVGPGGLGRKGGHGPATVVRVSGDVVTVRYRDGTTQQVPMTSGPRITMVVNGQAVSGSLGDLKSGETVDVRTAPTSVPAASPASPAAGATPTAGAAPAAQIRIHAAGTP